MRLRSTLPIASLLVLAVACGGSQPSPESASAPPPEVSSALPPAPIQSSAPPAARPEPVAAPTPAEAKPTPPPAVFRISEGIATPESVYYDEVGDRYLVSNVNGKPADADNNGYITEISPDGKVTKPKFIAAGENKVKLDAPKGSGIAGGIFYVADITVVRKFDAKTGAPKGDVVIPGAQFLNDIAVSKDGRVFVSDSGVNGKLEPTGGDAVYVIEKNGKVKTLAKSPDLKGPNGIWVRDKDVLVVETGGNELYRLDEKGTRSDVTPLPEGVLDGIIAVGDSLLVSSWKGSAIYRGNLGQKFEVAFPGLGGSADIGFDAKRKRVLVPRFTENAVEVYAL